MRGWQMTQKCIYSKVCFSVATPQLSERTGNPASQLPVGTKVRDGDVRVAMCLTPRKVLEELHGFSFLTSGVCSDAPLVPPALLY